MLDIKLFRANPEMVKEKLAARNLETDVVDLLIDLDKKRRELLVQVEDLKALRNKKSEEIAILLKLNKSLKKLTRKSLESLTLSLMRLLLEKTKMRISKFVVSDK